jgi:hypothetical protein
METKNDNLNAQESLDLITSMIRQTQGNVSENSFYLLLWGWTITLCNFGMYIIWLYVKPGYAPLVWLLCIPAGIATMIYSMKHASGKPMTHLERINMWLWIGMGITITPAWIFGDKINWMVNPVIFMTIGLATFLSGIIIRFRPMVIGGIVFWVSAILCYIVSPIDQYLVGGVAVILGYLVPGYMLRNINK